MEELCREYLDRARRHLPIEVRELESEAALLRALPPGAEVVALEPGGQGWDTPAFTDFVARAMNQGTKAIAFLIGGADGLGQKTVAGARHRVSLSPLTLPHRLARVVLCEQIYRALSRIRGEPYDR